jgi:hypothetical protein
MIFRLLLLMTGLLALASCEHAAQPTSTGGPQQGSERSIEMQVAHCWAIDPRWPGVKDMEVAIRAELDPDGAVRSVLAMPDQSKLSDPNYRMFVESAKRAIIKCSPLKFPASMPYEEWKTATFNFSPRDMGL